jgi:hypothetical protein
MNIGKRERLGWLGAVVVLLAGYLLCRFAREVAWEDYLADNPCDSVDEYPPEAVLALTGGTTFEHEVHDCQRLVLVSPDTVFGPLVGVFPLDGAMAMDRQEFSTARVVATIYNWGDFEREDMRYTPLGINPGWQCLWMRAINDAPTGWHVFIAPASGGKPCMAQSNPTHTVPAPALLHVHEQGVGAGLNSAWLPLTARWGWDEEDGVHYIGIRCGAAWCTIGPPGYEPRAWPTPTAANYWEVLPGWSDAQHLAVEDASSANGTRPGPWGTIRPTQRLAALDWTAPQEVAVIALQTGLDPAGFAAYQQKFDLSADGSGSLSLVFASNVSVQATLGSRTPRATFAPKVGHAAIGAVRWRWHDTDETIWVSCRGGCCHVEED